MTTPTQPNPTSTGKKFITLLALFLAVSAGLFLFDQHESDWTKPISQIALILLLLWFFGSYFSYYIRRYFEG